MASWSPGWSVPFQHIIGLAVVFWSIICVSSKDLNSPKTGYHNNPKYLDWQAWTNIVDPDQMLQKAAFYQGLLCLPLIKHYFRQINR